jgi:hypothetical protein
LCPDRPKGPASGRGLQSPRRPPGWPWPRWPGSAGPVRCPAESARCRHRGRRRSGSAQQGTSAPTARKWLGRFLAGGEAALGRRRHARPQPAAHQRVEGTGHRGAQATAADPGAHRRQPWTVRSHGQPRAAPRRPVQALEPAAGRARAALRAHRPRRAAAHRHQEARAHRAPSHRVTGRPPRQRRRRGLGDAVRGHRRPRPHRLHRRCTPTRRRRQCGGSSCATRCLLRQSGRARPAPAHRQRQPPSDQGVPHGLPGAGHPPQVHPPVPATNQRQGREIHPERLYASGPTASPTRTPASAPQRWTSGITTTTGTALMQALAASRPCPDSIGHETTS